MCWPELNDERVGIDAVTDYSDPALKEARLKILERAVGYRPAKRASDGVASFVRWYRECFQV